VARTGIAAIGSSAAALLCFWSNDAAATGYGDANVWMPVGLSTGYAFHTQGENGALIGAELSVVHLGDRYVWFGGYADFVADRGSDRARLSIGPEIGWKYFGIDGGFVLETGDRLRPGVALRPLLSAGFATLGLRGVKTFGDGGATLFELGFLLKIPIPIAVVDDSAPEPEKEPR